MPENDPDALGRDVRELIGTRIETPTHLDVLMALYREPRPALTAGELPAGPGAAWLYALRVPACVLILLAIVDKSRAARG